MPGLLVHSGMTMTCPHGGTVFLAGPPGALVDGLAVTTLADQLTVRGCPAQPTPCVTVLWANAGQILVNGSPVLLQAAPPTPPPVPGDGVCVGSVTPLPPQVLAMQLFVTGT
jgi:hypothetical protein